MSHEPQPNGPARRANALILALAADQLGLVSRAQLRHAGVAGHQIDRRLQSGLLRPVQAGVYLVGPVALPHARILAAVMACPGAIVSHQTAAGLWVIFPAMARRAGDSAPVRGRPDATNPSRRAPARRAGDAAPERGRPDATRPGMRAPGVVELVHITLPRACHRGRRPGIVAHRSNLRADETGRLDGIPLTTPARTLFDLSAVLTPRELEQAYARAQRAGLVTDVDLRRLLNRHPGRAGTRVLRELIERAVAPTLTRSEAEERLQTMLRTSGLPRPETNVKVHGIEVDCYWRQARLAVEVDGYAFHCSRPAFIRDHERDSALAAAGIQVLRLSWRQIERERDKTLVQLAQALARARR